MPLPPLILASNSPRRRQLLAAAGYRFDIIPADVDESDYPPATPPARLAELLAQRKAAAIAERFPNAVVLAADTVVALGDPHSGGIAIGKPTDPADAAAMMHRLAGTTHTVITAVCILHAAASFQRNHTAFSTVAMKPMTAAEIAAHVASNQWIGKAGGYGIQDQGHDPFVTQIDGSTTNIVGLPMELTRTMLTAAGIPPTQNDKPEPANQ